ncbi:glutathione S-transferase [Talaromyces proteolyticus]|uniref:Glutathione S-transferase n=1 Tax=Talaromyces proteolyticus TaxID=1131652 RepID=A0AAD4KM12_9EURO|nr:glutathione S-transferase [Talaromyces proteolyticus]KAH8692256.1 glutathione S-transferase [Talaromyces proteolyticus]
MSQNIKPIKVYGQGPSPNPLKLHIILKELGIPYEITLVPFTDVKKPEYLAINPNGRLPSIYDPNTNITLWESGAIVEYIIERYDTEHLLSFPAGTPEAYYTKQWLYFQTSGQGPYYGQMSWFIKFHPEKVPSAVDRYTNEVNRITGVLDKWLSKQKEEHGTSNNGPWLVGGKPTYADFAFVPWQRMAAMFADPEKYNQESYTYVSEWLGKMLSRKSVIDAIAESPPP